MRGSYSGAKLLGVILTFALSASLPRAGQSQETRDSLGSAEETRRSCAAAAAALAPGAGKAGETLANALRRVQTCPTEAPIALAQRWSAPPRDSAELRVFAGVTAQVRDKRLVGVAVAASRNQALPTDARLAALGVLVTYYRVDLFAVFPVPPGASERPRDYVRIGHWPDPMSFQGAEPLVESVARGQILSALHALATSEADVRVRLAASYLAGFLPTVK